MTAWIGDAKVMGGKQDFPFNFGVHANGEGWKHRHPLLDRAMKLLAKVLRKAQKARESHEFRILSVRYLL